MQPRESVQMTNWDINPFDIVNQIELVNSSDGPNLVGKNKNWLTLDERWKSTTRRSSTLDLGESQSPSVQSISLGMSPDRASDELQWFSTLLLPKTTLFSWWWYQPPQQNEYQLGVNNLRTDYDRSEIATSNPNRVLKIPSPPPIADEE